MHAIPLLALLALSAIPANAFASSLVVAAERIGFTSEDIAQNKATWSTPSKLPLESTPAGLGCDAMGERDMTVEACIETQPFALGTQGQPWQNVGVSVDVTGFVDKYGSSCVRRIFVRHSPDLKHWTTWQDLYQKRPRQLEAEQRWSEEMEPQNPRSRWRDLMREAVREDLSKRFVFVGTLVAPGSVRDRFEDLLREFEATKPRQPKSQEDAVRWILEKNPDYFAQATPPFVGYVQFQIEAELGKEQRLRSLVITYDSDAILDEDAAAASLDTRWSFVAP